MTRVSFFFLLLTLQIHRQPALISWLSEFTFVEDKALFGYNFLSISGSTVERCLERCLGHCRCMSFQMCDNTECQLCSSDQISTPSALRKRKGCTYFNLAEKDTKVINSEQCDNGCTFVFNCCMTSKPCLNGGTCQPAYPSPNKKTRFTCNCPSGYTGARCLQPIKSCRGYNTGSLAPGTYKIFDADMKPFDVFCDFVKNSSMAWTLIQSYDVQSMRKMKMNQSLVSDLSFSEDTPSWNRYRLPKSRMDSINQDSSEWRITCDYQSSGTVYTDYVRVSKEEVNLLTFNNGTCVKVEYIDIRGQHCRDCTALMIQTHNGRHIRPLHFDSFYSEKYCTFKPTGSSKCHGRGEDNFGLYDCKNWRHRCSASARATTNTWFGGDLNA